MQTIEHIIVVILFIIVVIQTIRSAYFKINYKALEELNEYHLEKIKDSSNESDHFEKANIYLRGKLDTVRQEYAKLENQFNYYKKNDWEHLYRLVDEKLKKERNRVKELESLIAATSLKKVKPLNTALDEMNKTADKWSDYHKQMNTTINKEDKVHYGGNHPAPKNITVYDVLGFSEDKEHLILQKQFSATLEEDEDQYNTVNEEQEIKKSCECDYCKNFRVVPFAEGDDHNESKFYKSWKQKQDTSPKEEGEIENTYPFCSIKGCNCQMCEDGRRMYQEWRAKQKSGHRKDSNEA